MTSTPIAPPRGARSAALFKPSSVSIRSSGLYFADYDWVVLCQLYGRMIDLPKGWPMYCRDLKQLIEMQGFQLVESDKQAPLSAHNALNDAQWCKRIYEKVMYEKW